MLLCVGFNAVCKLICVLVWPVSRFANYKEVMQPTCNGWHAPVISPYLGSVVGWQKLCNGSKVHLSDAER